MTDDSTAPKPISDAADIHQFELTSVFDIAHTLRQLMVKHELIAVYFHHGEHFTLTTIVGVDQKAQVFYIDQSGSADVNRRLLQSERNVFVATPDGIKHQFACAAVKAVTHEGHQAFQLPLPTSLIKLQRREYFRIHMPIVNPQRCKLFDHPAGRQEFPLHDISLGGLCLTMPNPRADFQVLDRFEDCTLDLPQFGTLRFGLEVRNRRVERQRNGNEVLYIGCQFLELSPSQQNVLQRYITQLQKDMMNKP
ncbi:flagellar brake protein [Chitinivorax sp. PXF-14]|uniref:flagellar brake protein n=1 Tax=Chitinivorax sp. PXF-14 TaxID=3230488 RepID=UPI00346798E9